MRDPAQTPQHHADGGTAMMDLYEFSEDPQTAGDVEVANHFTSTHPDSVFRRTLTIQRSARDGRVIGSFSVCGPLGRFTPDVAQRFGSIVMESAAKLSSELGI